MAQLAEWSFLTVILAFVSEYSVKETSKNVGRMGGSPGLVVMGGNSRTEGCEFESHHHILDRHFSNSFCVSFSLSVTPTHQCDQIGRFIGLWATFRAFGNI